MKVLCVQSPRTDVENAGFYVSELFEETGGLDFDLMVLPEKWVSTTVSQDEGDWKSLLESFAAYSREHRAIVVPGSFSVLRDGKLYNSAPVFINGRLEGFQDKIALFRMENDSYARGRSISVFGDESLKFAVPVCYDLDFPYFAKIAVEKGADFLVNPALIASEFAEMWYIYVKGRSLENRLPVISVNSLSDPFLGGSVVTRMRPQKGAIFLETENLGRDHFRIVETNSTELRDFARSRINEDFGQYRFRETE